MPAAVGGSCISFPLDTVEHVGQIEGGSTEMV